MMSSNVLSSPVTMTTFEKSSNIDLFSDQSNTLLPPATLTSPTKKSHLKTPPSSTIRETASNHFIDPQNSIERKSNVKYNGLLSPEFSSPSLYAPNINISIINDSPITEQRSENSKPLPAPVFKKKRTAETTNPSSNKRSKHYKSTSTDFIIPQPHEMPEINFTSDSKPPYSYATLIGMALLRSSERRLTLAEIYQWITDNFKYYKKGDVGWQNSIRHNLSLNKAFEKTEKSKEKKGHFWQIVSGYEHNYCNIKEIKRGVSTSNNSAKIQEPTTPRSQTNSSSDIDTHDDDDDDDDNDDINMADDENSRSEFDIIKTPKYNEQYNVYQLQTSQPQLLNHRNFNHIYHKNTNHSRNLSDGLNSIPEITISSGNSPFLVAFGASPGVPGSTSESLDFTSSFSCQSNFELSPLKLMEPDPIGPILEPITPNRSSHRINLPSITKQLILPLPNSSSSNSNSSSAGSSLSILHPNTSSMPFKHSTPIRYSHTPISNSLLNTNGTLSRKIWASPSYLDDFYTSPIAHGRKQHQQLSSLHNQLQQSQSQTQTKSLQQRYHQHQHHHHQKSNIYGSPIPAAKRRLNMMNNGYSTNDIFGIDICTIQTNEYDDSN